METPSIPVQSSPKPWLIALIGGFICYLLYLPIQNAFSNVSGFLSELRWIEFLITGIWLFWVAYGFCGWMTLLYRRVNAPSIKNRTDTGWAIFFTLVFIGGFAVAALFPPLAGSPIVYLHYRARILWILESPAWCNARLPYYVTVGVSDVKNKQVTITNKYELSQETILVDPPWAEIAVWLAKHPNLSASKIDQLTRVYRELDWTEVSMARELIRQSHLTPQALKLILSQTDRESKFQAIIKEQSANFPHLSPELRAAYAEADEVSPEILVLLAEDPEAQVRSNVHRNQHTPPEVRQRLDSDAAVHAFEVQAAYQKVREIRKQEKKSD